MTYNENIIAKAEWNSLQGVILNGVYQLLEALETNDGSAVFSLRILSGGTGKAYFFQPDPQSANEQIDIWETLREFPHPNLAAPLGTGRLKGGGAEAIYVVMADPDEKLAAIIPERALEWEEAAELLSSLEKGLAHLHFHGFAHGCVSLETVGAVGYSVQLSTECVRKLNHMPIVPITKASFLAPESVAENVTTQADVWCLGATLFEALSQKRYGSTGAASFESLPLGAVVKRCLESDPRSRCTLKEAEAKAQQGPEPLLSFGASPVARPEPLVIPPPPTAGRQSTSANPQIRTAAAVVDIPEPARARPTSNVRTASDEKQRAQAAAAKNVAAHDMVLVPVGKRQRSVRRQAIGAKIKTVERQGQTEQDDRSAVSPSIGSIVRVNPKPGAWRTIVAGSAAVAAIVALVSFVIIPRLQSPIERAQTQEQGVPTVVPDLPASAPAAAEIGKAPDTHVDPSVNVAPVSMEPAKREDSAAGESEDKWRVVIYSYSHAIDAQRRVQLISADHPGVQAHVYSPNVNGPYLVVTGDAMSRAEANRMRDRVVELGMPESTRIESFKD